MLTRAPRAFRPVPLLVLAVLLGPSPNARALPEGAAAKPPDALALLQEYLRIDTSNPPGNETKGALFLKGVLEKAGIPAEIHETAPGRGNVYARLAGQRKGDGLLLHHHIDVVPADPKGWDAPPFAGKRFNDRLVGRGTIDTKGLGVAQLLAFVALKTRGRPLARDVVFLATADEEAGGGLGVAPLMKARPAWFAGLSEAIGEAGENETVVDRARYFGVSVQDKGALWLRIEARGHAGHASTTDTNDPVTRIARAVVKLSSLKLPPRVTPVVGRQLAVAAPTRTAADAPLFREIAARMAADPAGVLARLTPAQTILVTDTVTVTRIGCDSPKVNARPASAWAEVDCRLLPGTDPKGFLANLEKSLGDPGLKVQVLLDAIGGPASPEEGVFKVIAQTLGRRFPGTIVGPLLCPGLSENRVLRGAGIRAYGLLPFRVNYYDAAGIHGTNERIRVDWFLEGTAAVAEIVTLAAATTPTSGDPGKGRALP